ncbi:hypothetical protein Nepgr_012491, partial [Nepenthes gracilis]
MDPYRYTRIPTEVMVQVGPRSESQAHQAEAENPLRQKVHCHPRADKEIARRRLHQGSLVSRLALQLVLIKKSNEKSWIGINFSDVNKSCPKDSFPLPRINLLVDTTSGHELLSFMHIYFSYNQIPMSPKDEVHTSFMMDQETYYYKVIPFKLKNIGATYQRFMNKSLKPKLAGIWR